MLYFGGKSRLAKKIANTITFYQFETGYNKYIEPFCGGIWVTEHIIANDKVASDSVYPLIVLYKSVQNGWIPPINVSEETYNWYKDKAKNDYDSVKDDPMLAFLGFGLSFSGKWFGGFARDSKNGRNYARTARNNLLRKVNNCIDVNFYCCDYKDYSPSKSIIYCDPPYANTTSYDAIGSFKHEEFWMKMCEWSKNNVVLVSEYSIPPWVNNEIIYQDTVVTDMNTKQGKDKRVEKLFEIKGYNNE